MRLRTWAAKYSARRKDDRCGSARKCANARHEGSADWRLHPVDTEATIMTSRERIRGVTPEGALSL